VSLGKTLNAVSHFVQTEQLLCWSGMTDTEHSTTSSSNEEDDVNDHAYLVTPIKICLTPKLVQSPCKYPYKSV